MRPSIRRGGAIAGIAATVLVLSIAPASAGGPGQKGPKPKNATTTTTTAPTTTTTTAPTTTTTTAPTTTTTTAPTTTTTTIPPTGETVAVPASIPSDCSVPADAEINRFIDSVPDGSTIQFGAGGCYGYDDVLLVQDRRQLTIDGGGSTFRALSYGHLRRSGWRAQGGSDITLRNMTVVGWNPEGTYHRDDEWQHGIDFRGVAGGLADGVTATETLGDGLYVGHDMRHGDFTAPSTGITTRGSTFTKIGRMGIGFVNVDGAILESSHFDAIALSAVDVEPDTDDSTARGITVRNNTFGAVMHAIFTDGGKGGGPLRGNITVEGNRQTAIAPTCIPAIIVTTPVGMERSGYTIRDNTVNTRSIAVRLIRVTDVIVDGNTAEWRSAGCGRSEAVDLVGSHRIDITNNTLYGFMKLLSSVDSTYTESGNTMAPLPA